MPFFGGLPGFRRKLPPPTRFDGASWGAAETPGLFQRFTDFSENIIDSLVFIGRGKDGAWLNIVAHGAGDSSGVVWALKVQGETLELLETAEMVRFFQSKETFRGVHLVACNAARGSPEKLSFAERLSVELGGMPVKAYGTSIFSCNPHNFRNVDPEDIFVRPNVRSALRSYLPRVFDAGGGRVSAPIRFDGDIIEQQVFDHPHGTEDAFRYSYKFGGDVSAML